MSFYKKKPFLEIIETPGCCSITEVEDVIDDYSKIQEIFYHLLFKKMNTLCIVFQSIADYCC